MSNNANEWQVKRRAVLGGLASAATLVPIAGFATAETSLKSIAASKGIRFGSTIGDDDISDQRLTALIDRECAMIVPENEFKAATIVPTSSSKMDFTPGNQMVRFARRHHQAVRGTALLWPKDEVNPAWLRAYDFGPRPKAAAEAMLREYIGAVTRHFGPEITSWDVVNEAIDPITGELRSSVFTRILGHDAIRIAFEAAHESAPGTPLVYNDYVDWRTTRETHRMGVLNLLRWLQDGHAPIAALGIQSHIKTGQTPYDPEGWEIFLKAVTAMGLEIKITEFDMNDQLAVGTIAERDQESAQMARRYLDLVLNFKEVKEVLLWGICDATSYMAATRTRPDGLPVRPTPYDDRFNPKPLRDAIASALRVAPDRS